MPIHGCRARPLFVHLCRESFVVDALIESSDDPAVPPGTPFSLCLAPPERPDDYLFSQLRTTVERGHPFSVEVEAGEAGRRARLGANGWTTVLPLQHASGWPAPSPV